VRPPVLATFCRRAPVQFSPCIGLLECAERCLYQVAQSRNLRHTQRGQRRTADIGCGGQAGERVTAKPQAVGRSRSRPLPVGERTATPLAVHIRIYTFTSVNSLESRTSSSQIEVSDIHKLGPKRWPLGC
jgi:hypothetical protein